eukprot:CFRG7692T1
MIAHTESLPAANNALDVGKKADTRTLLNAKKPSTQKGSCLCLNATCEEYLNKCACTPQHIDVHQRYESMVNMNIKLIGELYTHAEKPHHNKTISVTSSNTNKRTRTMSTEDMAVLKSSALTRGFEKNDVGVFEVDADVSLKYDEKENLQGFLHEVSEVDVNCTAPFVHESSQKVLRNRGNRHRRTRSAFAPLKDDKKKEFLQRRVSFDPTVRKYTTYSAFHYTRGFDVYSYYANIGHEEKMHIMKEVRDVRPKSPYDTLKYVALIALLVLVLYLQNYVLSAGVLMLPPMH